MDGRDFARRMNRLAWYDILYLSPFFVLHIALVVVAGLFFILRDLGILLFEVVVTLLGGGKLVNNIKFYYLQKMKPDLRYDSAIPMYLVQVMRAHATFRSVGHLYTCHGSNSEIQQYLGPPFIHEQPLVHLVRTPNLRNMKKGDTLDSVNR